MDAVIDRVQRNCDFERIEQAIANRQLLERFQTRFFVTFVVGAGIAAGIAWWWSAPDGVMTALLAFAGCMAVYWLYRRRLMERWGELAEQCKKGDPAAYETFHRSARWQLSWERIAAAFGLLWVAVFAVIWLAQGRSLMGLWAAAVAVLGGAIVLWHWRPSERKREEAFITGEIGSDEYFVSRKDMRRTIRLVRFLKLLKRGPGER